MGLFSSSKKYLGVDIGSLGVKIIELSSEGDGVSLRNYGFNELKIDQAVLGGPVDVIGISKSIANICKKAEITTKDAVVALPTFSVFSSVLTLVDMPDKSLDSAVQWEAKKIIPLPLEEMVLDWKRIPKDKNAPDQENVQVLITGAPRSLVNSYIEIFKKAQLNLISLETETFSLIRSILGGDKSTVMIVDMGANTTDIAIIEKSIPILSRSIETAGITITRKIQEELKMDIHKAEQFKCDLGLSSGEENLPNIIKTEVLPIINEIKYLLNAFEEKNNSNKVDKIILSGGGSKLLNFDKFLSAELNKTVILGNPWDRVIYPYDLESVLEDIGPRMSVAIGLGMRELS